MAFQGDDAQIPLTNILQALMLNGQEGVLTVESESFRHRIRLLKYGIRPLSYSPKDPDLLKLALMKQKALTEAQFQNVFANWDSDKLYPGDFLVRRHIITAEAVEKEFRVQIESLLLDIFLTPNVKYEFSVDLDAEPYEMFSPNELGQLMLFNVNSILMEAARREDEWTRFRAAIPDEQEVFRITDRARLSARGVKVTPGSLKEIKPFLHGETTVRGMFSETTLSHYDVYEVLFQLKEAGLIRPLALEEKKALAEKLRRGLRHQEAIPIYKSVLLNDPSDVETRQRLIALLEAESDQEQLVPQYLELAKSFETTSPQETVTLLKKVLQIVPDNLSAFEKVFEFEYKARRPKEALSILRKSLATAKLSQSAQACTETLRRLTRKFPQEAALFQELADVHVLAKDTASAISELAKAAAIFKSRKDVHRLRKVCDKIARLRPGEKTRVRRSSEARPKKSGRTTRWIRFCALIAVPVLFLSVLAFVGASEYYSRKAFAVALRDVAVHKKYGSFHRALTALDTFSAAFPISTKRFEAGKIAVEINGLRQEALESAREQREKRGSKAEALLVRAQIEASRENLREALNLLKQVDSAALTPSRAEKYATLRNQLTAYYSQAEDLVSKAKVAREVGDIPKSHAYLKHVLTRFPRSPLSRKILLPIEFQTRPPGANVMVDGKAVGVTPGAFDFTPTPPDSVVVSKTGYAPVDLSRTLIDGKLFEPLEFARISLSLQKSLEWHIQEDAPVECTPLALADTIVVGTRSGKITALSQKSGKRAWSYTVPTRMDVTGGLGEWNDTVYFGGFDGEIYVLKSRTGNLVYPPVSGSPPGEPIKTAPTPATPEGLALFNVNGKWISSYDLTKGTIRWSIPSKDGLLLGTPITYKGSAYAPTKNGVLLQFDFDTPNVVRKADLPLRPTYPAGLGSGRIVVADKVGRVAAFDLDNWKEAWSHETPGKISAPPTVEGELLIVPEDSGYLTCLTVDGQLKWRKNVQQVISSEGLIFRNSFIVGSTSGTILSLDTWTGNSRWSFSTSRFPNQEPKALLSSGAVSKGRFFIGSENHALYCLTLD